MTMAELELWIIFVAIIAIVPCGCILTRPKKNDPHL
jgi:hypothetical protein